MTSRFRVSKRTRGLALYDDRGKYLHPLTNLSYMDAARLLFDLKDFLRADQIGRGCVDQVAEARRRTAA